jgi:hypothetical protein
VELQRRRVETQPSTAGRKLRNLFFLFVAAVVATSAGCVTTQPRVTAKVIFQDESGVAAELSSEWR